MFANPLWSVLILLALGLVLVLVWYALAGRRWLRTTVLGTRFLAWIEPVEIALYRKSETLLVGRMTWFGAGIVTVYDGLAIFASSLDLTPITTRILAPVPPDLRGIVLSSVIGVLGLIISWLRKRTAKPVELVAAPTTPETVAAEDKVDKANAEAVAVAEAVKAA